MEKCLIRYSANEVVREIDLISDGETTILDWIQFDVLKDASLSLVAQTTVSDVLRDGLRARMVKQPEWLERTQRKLQAADEAGTGSLPVAFLRQLFSDELHLELGKSAIQGVAQDIPYTVFKNAAIGEGSDVVQLYFYDLTTGFSRWFAPLLQGHTLEHLWHISVVVHDTEFWYAGRVFASKPSQTTFGVPSTRRRLVRTKRSLHDVWAFCRQLSQKFTIQGFDIFSRNCNHFCDELLVFLMGERLPSDFLELTDELYRSNLARGLQSVLNRWMGRYRGDAVDAGAAIIDCRRLAVDSYVSYVGGDGPRLGQVVKANIDGTYDIVYFERGPCLDRMKSVKQVALDQLALAVNVFPPGVSPTALEGDESEKHSAEHVLRQLPEAEFRRIGDLLERERQRVEEPFSLQAMWYSLTTAVANCSSVKLSARSATDQCFNVTSRVQHAPGSTMTSGFSSGLCADP